MDSASRYFFTLDNVTFGNPSASPFAVTDFKMPRNQSCIITTDTPKKLYPLLNCISGISRFTSGKFNLYSSISWPICELPGKTYNLSALENTKFIYQVFSDHHDLYDLDQVRVFSRMSMKMWDTPLKELPYFTKKAFLASLPLLLNFDLYIINPSLIRDLMVNSPHCDYWLPVFSDFFAKKNIFVLQCPFFDFSSYCDLSVDYSSLC